MHAKTIIAALAAPALISAAAIPQNDPDNWDESNTEIVGGVVASQGDFPFIISLQTSSGSHFCGGTLLNANTVLTAAHCLAGQSASALRIRAGSLNNNSGGTTAAVSSIKIHPNYNADTSDFDVGIVKLSTSVPSGGNIAYATLAAAGSDPASGTTTTVAGWGRLSSGGTAPTNLRKVDVPVVARNTCNSASYYSGQITNNMFCAGLQAGGKDSCQGDSGGPIINASSKTLVGVVSWGYGCAQPNKPGVYASVGALSSFIRGNL